MPAKNDDLHGSVPDEVGRSAAADRRRSTTWSSRGASACWSRPCRWRSAWRGSRRRARALGIPTVYVNDNFGRWRSDLRSLVAHCLEEGVRGRPVVQRLLPDEQDYFVLKPKHSGFFSTTLDTLLTYLKASTLILAGITGDVLRAVYGERRLHARLPLDRPRGRLRLDRPSGQRLRRAPDAAGAQGGRHPGGRAGPGGAPQTDVPGTSPRATGDGGAGAPGGAARDRAGRRGGRRHPCQRRAG